jgi:hypothetical protein
MTRSTSIAIRITLATVVAAGCLTVSDQFPYSGSRSLLSQAQALIGRPLTPFSYAGVARRTARRGYGAYGAYAAPYPVPMYAAPVPVYPAVGCFQAVDVYGRVYYRCP